jgi:hypothetical protein
MSYWAGLEGESVKVRKRVEVKLTGSLQLGALLESHRRPVQVLCSRNLRVVSVGHGVVEIDTTGEFGVKAKYIPAAVVHGVPAVGASVCRGASTAACATTAVFFAM